MASATYTQYLTTQFSAAGGGPVTAVVQPVPTLSTWGMLLLISIVVALAV